MAREGGSVLGRAGVANGPVKAPAAKNGVLTFQTNRGTYKLRPNGDRKWAGSAMSLDKTFSSTVTLVSTK